MSRKNTGALCEHWNRFNGSLSKGRGPSVQNNTGSLQYGVYTPEAAVRGTEWGAGGEELDLKAGWKGHYANMLLA